jgi:HAD superfamily hydrolase (TIGR01509 family)
MSRQSLVIFDCDGVLVDSEGIACKMVAICLKEIGLAISSEEIMDHYLGVSATTMLSDLEQRYGIRLPGHFAATLRDRIRVAFEAELKAMDGVENAINMLPLRKCVASSSDPERIRRSLTKVGLLKYFEPNIFSTTQVSRGKPEPDLFLFAATQMNTRPEHCLVVEDSLAGLQAALAAGMPALGFTGGERCRPNRSAALQKSGALETFNEMRSLPQLVIKYIKGCGQ